MKVAGNRARRIRAVAAGLPLSVIFVAGASPAATSPGYEISVGAGTSDNIARTSTNEKSETMALAGLQLDWREQRVRMNADVSADVQYVDYLNNTFGSEFVGNASGRLGFALLPERLNWQLSDNFGQGRIDPLSASSPQNRENINYFSTGPDLTLPFGSSMELLASGRYSKVTYEVTPVDSSRYSGAVGLQHKLSDSSSVSLNVTHDSVQYDDDIANPDYDRESAYARYKVTGRRTELALDAGYTKIDRTVGNDTDGALFRLELSRRLSASSIIAVSAGHEFSDAADAFRMSQALSGGGLDTQGTLQTSSPFTNDYATVAWNFARNRTDFAVGVSRFEESYADNSQLDRDRTLANVSANRQITPTLRLGAVAGYTRENYQHLVGDSRELAASLLMSYRMTRHLTLTARYQYAHHTSEIPNTDFSENRTWLQIGWGQPSGEVRVGPVRPGLPGDVVP
jgi:hypothetical protein